MKLKDLMTRDVVTTTSNQSVIVAATRMRELNVGSLVVTTGTDVEGIITTWDLTVGCMGVGHNPRECLVFHHMSTPVHTARPDMDTLEAAHVMAKRKITRLPVVEDGKLIGIVSFSNVSRAMEQLVHDLLAGWSRPSV